MLLYVGFVYFYAGYVLGSNLESDFGLIAYQRIPFSSWCKRRQHEPATTPTKFVIQISARSGLSIKPKFKCDLGSLVPEKARVDAVDTVEFSF